jgi:hypothetical protein
MRCLPFLPLAFLAGMHGFVFFAPYLLAFAALDQILYRTAKRRLRRCQARRRTVARVDVNRC